MGSWNDAIEVWFGWKSIPFRHNFHVESTIPFLISTSDNLTWWCKQLSSEIASLTRPLRSPKLDFLLQHPLDSVAIQFLLEQRSSFEVNDTDTILDWESFSFQIPPKTPTRMISSRTRLFMTNSGFARLWRKKISATVRWGHDYKTNEDLVKTKFHFNDTKGLNRYQNRCRLVIYHWGSRRNQFGWVLCWRSWFMTLTWEMKR
jgi:hypothetical protein